MLSTIPEHIRQDPALTNRLRVAIENLQLLFSPKRIVLFGSYARGDYKADSTIDIFVIADTEKRFVDRIRHAIEVTGGFPPIEPLIYTPEEFDLLKRQGEGFIESALEEGIVLYEKNNGEEMVQL